MSKTRKAESLAAARQQMEIDLITAKRIAENVTRAIGSRIAELPTADVDWANAEDAHDLLRALCAAGDILGLE